mmetsp:Transcript_29542/g.95249  ORF Transcript_29542/g.95249 Transcript_29542/m.95249 type:complete len:229 (-) Transcript_29542:614-1300(-)
MLRDADLTVIEEVAPPTPLTIASVWVEPPPDDLRDDYVRVTTEGFLDPEVTRNLRLDDIAALPSGKRRRRHQQVPPCCAAEESRRTTTTTTRGKDARGESAFRDVRGRDGGSLFRRSSNQGWCPKKTLEKSARRASSRCTVATGCRWSRGSMPAWSADGSTAARRTSSPTYGAVASTAPGGTAPPSERTGSGPSTTSTPSPPTSCDGASSKVPSSSGPRARRTAVSSS